MSQTKVLVGISGSIAAFKGAQLCSDLVKDGYSVRVVMTRGGTRFISPLTFEGITDHPVTIDVWDERPGESGIGHLELANWADAVVVAPASAGTIARLALGFTDDMLSAVALATSAPILIAPGMETRMWNHPATQKNVRLLQSQGATFVGPESGRLASGAYGDGRMAPLDAVESAIRLALRTSSDLKGQRVLLTSGPTFEPIDPVRFIGNRSSGRMGQAIATEARARGATVTVISGPTSLPPSSGVTTVNVETSSEMLQAVRERAADADVVIMAAAVADFRPVHRSEQKLKRLSTRALQLEPTPDIAAVAVSIAPHAVHVGFALESEHLIASAQEKRLRKGQHLVVANAISQEHNPFGSDTNRVVFVSENATEELPELSKREIAYRLWDRVVQILVERDVLGDQRLCQENGRDQPAPGLV